jgi:hypothetical protein
VVNTFVAPFTNTWLVKTDSLGSDSSNCSIYIGIKEFKEERVNVMLYPNPNKGIFKLLINSTFNRDEIIDVSIYDILGQTINYKKLDNNTGAKLFEIETETLYEGIYFIKLTQNNKNIWQSKFVIEK